MSPEAEQAVIERARDGSLEAFDTLMREHQDRLYGFLRVRGLEPADARDVLQDTFLAAWRHLGSYRSRWRFSTWLYTIARRRAGRRRGPAAVPERPAPPGPDTVASADQLRDNLWTTARRLLSDEPYTALWLHYGEERTVEEIATILGRGRSWVKVNLHRSRKRLGEYLERETELSGHEAY